MKTRMLLLLGCMLAMSSNAQTTKREMWVWKDANGVTHYSDIPAPGAKKMEIIGTTPVAPPPSQAPSASSAPARPAVRDQRRYTSLEFLAPEDGGTFFGPDTEVEVRWRSEPELASADQLSLYLDGTVVEAARNASYYKFTNLERGSHSVIAVIRDGRGEEQIRSTPRSFSIQQTAVDNPRNVGPALKPKPIPPPAPAPKPAPPKSNK